MPATYSETDFVRIAAAIKAAPELVQEHARPFEAAAEWYRLGRRGPDRPSPSRMRAKMQRIAGAARRLLEHLGVEDPSEAADGPGDPDIYEVLTYAPDTDRDLVKRATERIGRLVEIMDAIEAAATIHKASSQAVAEVTRLGDLTVAKGHVGDAVANQWIASMMSVYKAITGSEPTISVGAPDRRNEGKPTGPFLRFLNAAAKPIGLTLTDAAWRSRVRAIHAQEPEQN